MKAAIVAYKTEKRREFEVDAAVIIEKTYRKFVFRHQLQRAIASRAFMINGLTQVANINRCRKIWIAKRQVMKIVDKAFVIGKLKKEQRAVYKIQRILRGHIDRAGKHELIIQAVTSKVQLKQ